MKYSYLGFIGIVLLLSKTVNASDSTVKEHIVTFNNKEDLNEAKAELLSDGRPSASIKNEFSFGSFHALVLEYEEAVASSFNQKYKNIEDNAMVHAFVTTRDTYYTPTVAEGYFDSCLSQQTGSKYWGLTRTSSRQRPIFSSYDEYMYDSDGSDVDIYIVDSGVYTEHNTFEGRARHGMTAATLRADEGDADLNGHGTHVAGLAAGSTHGTAKVAKVVAVKVLDYKGDGYYSWIIEGLEWIYQQARGTRSVINMSLGAKGYSYTMENAIQAIINDIGPVVVAAGNDDESACLYTPARMPDAITVAATDGNDHLTTFTNYGPCVDILAPGYSLLSAGTGSANHERPDSGTSMASPLVAGVVARILSEHSEAYPDAQSLKSSLLESATTSMTDATKFYTPDLLLYASCAEPTSAPSDVLTGPTASSVVSTRRPETSTSSATSVYMCAYGTVVMMIVAMIY